ncbi:anthranilate phosphoribosyltransferase [Gilvimarinus agarilyticus]|uniref:anthranilate phosphoribosyltransferase n=1 Tax=unclassified Gilvimarinus TaxID=2642066 RepID=UPI001C09B8BE|nr:MULTISPECIES: anthranilate phosphoribosyltransferase [unclassified Gilvimarinus]MBU2887564.1 anthranilate phosphoribosyltransferase [Gilvimarinus agarilyticus]MDO6572215.1 anthranilate phosphoribosyltransferase [Gilvimarinus sp. 2_MG-2023]MDO6746777.1 anthranilate phosphoribosyltransferase [Gilvimarinus sp. 1_MG-2023]
MDIKQALAKVVDSIDLSTDEMIAVMRQVMTGEASDAQIGALLVALRMKGESLDEMTGAATVMRELASQVSIDAEHLVDTCGTGGDGANLFNVSTASAFVVAAAGGSVAKHGNRSVSSSTGSADVLEAAGVNLTINAEQVARCVEALGVGFMFAPAHHSAMKHAIGPRKELGLRTIFNMLGPMTNPAGVKRQVIGVFSEKLCKPMAEVLGRLGSEHVMVVHAADGLDEISLASVTHVAELKNGEVCEYTIAPEDFGLESQSLIGLAVEDAEQSLAIIHAALGRKPDELGQKAGDVIALNAGAAIYVCGVADSLAEGVAMAQDAIGSGLAGEKLRELVSFTQCF